MEIPEQYWADKYSDLYEKYLLVRRQNESLKDALQEIRCKTSDLYQLPLFDGDLEQGRKFTDITAK